QTASLIAALPFAFVLIFMIISLVMMMTKDHHALELRKQRRRDKKLKKSVRDETYEDLKEDLREEIIDLGRNNAEMIQFQTNEDTPIVGKEIRDIAFPPHVSISAIERGDNIISPSGSTVIEAGDFLY